MFAFDVIDTWICKFIIANSPNKMMLNTHLRPSQTS